MEDVNSLASSFHLRRTATLKEEMSAGSVNEVS